MIEQGTDEWKALRLGKATASRVSDIVAKTKTGFSASRANYMAELVAERLTGTPSEGFISAAMKQGTEKEPLARDAYQFLMNTEVEQTAFVPHPTIDMAGASPDGLVGDEGLVEIKCPYTATHIETLLSKTVPAKYDTQINWQLACTGRQWCDFVSFDPRLPEQMQLFVKRVHRDDVRIKELETAVAAFLAELDQKVLSLKAAYMATEEAA